VFQVHSSLWVEGGIRCAQGLFYSCDLGGFMKTLLFLALLAFLGCGDYQVMDATKYKKSTRWLMEYAYFEGQRDFLSGDVRIVIYNGKYIWKNSPWDGGSLDAVLYNPQDTNAVSGFTNMFCK
jgi:hypothetical protein